MSADQPEFSGTIAREEIKGDEEDLLAVAPSRKEGVDFIRANNAWGFVRMNREPEFVAIYISEDVQQVKYVGRVREIVEADEASLSRPADEYEGYDSGKKVLVFEDDSVYELEDPIPYENRVIFPSFNYTTLGDFKNAESTDDLF
ncbi:hypothetical protein GRS48_12650 [Halorubrum sp. JWXQ-INN 858]|uniref:hypothetical protein n=1 Tax=Halorubrum sp. JWXQ-INN 858 TaxID=2690782 RepID=UPI001356C30F|nr:hypothetical protein [Halorubrum sp. JWXQ-INN 858]MWV65662.1 hypothetical protein [Halorubrum sp. JWXQ-INN 858]